MVPKRFWNSNKLTGNQTGVAPELNCEASRTFDKSIAPSTCGLVSATHRRGVCRCQVGEPYGKAGEGM